MNNDKGIGLIECGTTEKSFSEASVTTQNCSVSKAYAFHAAAKSGVRTRFPEAEIASTYEAIFHDDAIKLVLISAPSSEHRSLIGEALKANKQVQIV